MMTNDTPRVRIPPPLIVLTLLTLGLALDGRLVAPRLNAPVPASIGFGLITAGLAIGMIALGLFRRARTRPEPWKASSALVTRGVYRFTRNPMYLGMLLLAAGAALAYGGFWSVISLVLIFLALNFYAVAREEAYLERRFGKSYRDYRDRVRRWF